MRQLFLGLTMALSMLTVATAWSAAPPAATDGRAPASAMQQLAESMLTDIQQTTWISEGKGPHVVYVFFDPNCPYCHQLYLNTRAWIREGKVELRWIPVGILTATSADKAAAILGSKDPLQAFYANEDHYSKGGGIEEDLASPEVEQQLKANAALLARTRYDAVPAMLFRLSDDSPFLIQGSPPKEKLAVILQNLK